MARPNLLDGFRRIDDHIDRRAFRPLDWSPGSPVSAPQLARFNRDGVLVLPRFFPEDEVAALHAEVLRLLDDPPTGADRHQQIAAGRLKEVHQHSTVLASLPRGRMATWLSALHGPVDLHQSFILFKKPGSARIKPWHQDAVYWGGQPTVLGLVSLTDIEQERGCVWVVPGSHRLGRLHHRVEPDEDGWQNLVCDVACLRSPRPLETRRGDLIVLHGLTVHASFENRTDEPRITLGYHFEPRAETP